MPRPPTAGLTKREKVALIELAKPAGSRDRRKLGRAALDGLARRGLYDAGALTLAGREAVVAVAARLAERG